PVSRHQCRHLLWGVPSQQSRKARSGGGTESRDVSGAASQLSVVSCQLSVVSGSQLAGRSWMGQAFRDLLVWQRSMQLTVAIYGLTQGFPQEERYGLTSQIRRSAVSIPSN